MIQAPLKRKPPTAKIVAGPSTVKPATKPMFGSCEIPIASKFIMIYAEPGEGKTTLAAQFPKPIFIITSGETGIDAAKRVGVADKTIPVIRLHELYQTDSIPNGSGHPGFEECLNILDALASEGHDRLTIVIDTLSGMEQLALQHCSSLEFHGDMKGRGKDDWNSWAAGSRRTCEGYWLGEFIPACIRCVEAGLTVVLLAHCTLRNVPNPVGPDFQIYQPDLSKSILNATSKALQYLLYLGRNREFQTDEKTKKRTVNASNRFVGVTNDTWYMAKNWFNLQDPIFCGDSAAATYSLLKDSMDF